MTDNVGKKVICYNCRGEGHVSRQCKEKKRVKDSQYFKDKMLLMEAKEKGTALDAEAEAFLADVECTAPYDLPLAITTTNMFEVSHEDAYDSDVDEGTHAVAAFMANLSSTSGTNCATTRHVNEVHTDANQIFDNVNHLLTHEMHQEEHLDSDVESDIDDNTILYHQYQLDSEVQDVPTEVSSAPPGEISMITILDDLRTQLDGHLKVNQEQSLVNDSLRVELAKCKLEIVRLDTQQVKLDLECQVRQEQNLVTQRNERNAELEQEKVMLKIHLKSKDVLIEFLKSKNQKVLTDKKKLEDKYLDEIPVLEVIMATMKGKPRMLRPASGFYKSSIHEFVPQRIFSQEQVNWLPGQNEMLDKASTSHQNQVDCTNSLDTDRIQLQDMITSLRIQLDGLKVENVSLKRRYDELSKANTHSRTAYTEKLNALTAENAKLKTELKQTATGKEISNPFIVDSLLKTISKYEHVGPKFSEWRIEEKITSNSRKSEIKMKLSNLVIQVSKIEFLQKHKCKTSEEPQRQRANML
ncbi:TRAF-type zinc finger domain-containing protein 1-like protein [Tanacetum coccineum]